VRRHVPRLRISIALSPYLLERLDAFCRRTGTNRAQLIRTLIANASVNTEQPQLFAIDPRQLELPCHSSQPPKPQ
jgi:predicted DNA-binding protein